MNQLVVFRFRFEWSVLMLLVMFSWSCLVASGSARSMWCFLPGYSQYSSLLSRYSILKQCWSIIMSIWMV